MRAPALLTNYPGAVKEGRYSYWEGITGDSIRVVWGTERSGQVFRLLPRGDTLTGTTTFGSDIFRGRIIDQADGKRLMVWDAPRSEPVFARKVVCPGADSP